MIKRIVKLTLQTESVETFPRLFEIIKDQITEFDGCHGVELQQDTKDPRVFFTYSQWDSENALGEYKKSEFFGKTWKTLKAMFDDKPQAWSTNIITISEKHW